MIYGLRHTIAIIKRDWNKSSKKQSHTTKEQEELKAEKRRGSFSKKQIESSKYQKESSNQKKQFEINTLTNNAYRILGLPVTSSKREIYRRIEEIQTYLKMDITPHYDSDFPWLGKLHRNEETVKKALRELDNPNTKLNHLLSWFWVVDEYDNSAIDALKNREIIKAIDIWFAAANQENNHYRKNLATIEQILAFQESASDHQHLNNCINYWAELISSNQLSNLIASLDTELSKISTDTEIVKFIGNNLRKTAMPLIEKWADGKQLDKIKAFFNGLNESGLPQETVSYIKEHYVNPILEKIDNLYSEFSTVCNDHETIYYDTGIFFENVNPYFEQLKQSGDAFFINSYGDKIGGAILDSAIDYGNKGGQWEKSKELCGYAQLFITGAVLKNRLDKNISVISENANNEQFWKDIKPIDRAPSFGTIFGIGTKLYGDSNRDPESNTYETTLYFTFYFIPIIPLARYRVIEENDCYRFLGKVPFRIFDKWHLVLAPILIIVFFLAMDNSGTNSTSYSPKINTKPRSPPVSSKSYNATTRSQEIKALGRKIDSNKLRLKTMESELSSLSETLANYKNRFETLKEIIENTESKIQRDLYVNEVTYENNIDEHNDILKKAKTHYADYEKKLEIYNNLFSTTEDDVERYNRLIR